ncbi:MAG: DedA family protein [Vampirovibrionales bacterium]|nr:DedA family protein [Vampirovibrionales bacterium]
MDFFVQLGQSLINLVWGWINWVIETMGYLGIALLMAIESFNIPLPSEMILTSAGVLVHDGKLNLHLAALFGALGCVLGSVPSYWIGYFGGRPFVQKYGKWLLVSEHDLNTAQVWSNKYGDWAFFVCRMLPVARTFISLPAGVLKNNFWRFITLTFIGSWIWSYGLVYAGVVFADNLEAFKHIWHKFDYLIVGLLFILGVLYVWKHVKHFQEASKDPTQ